MSFLTPLYLAGMLAISLPLVFHMIRRSPRGQFPFSSLMFLTSSPPRLTRKSRLDHLLLLLLRATILALLALAFARPLWRGVSPLGVDEAAGRRIAILLDTSASMQRAGLWQQARGKADRLIDDLGPGDDAALYAVGGDVDTLVPLNDVVPADPRQHVIRLRAVLRGLTPTWSDTDFGGALVAAADELHDLGRTKKNASDLVRQIVLISDLQQGGRLDSLQNYDWPDDVQLAVERVAPAQTTNAGLFWVGDLDGAAEQRDDLGIRVRISNDSGSDTADFELRWADTDGAAGGSAPISAYVPPGESRMVRVPRPNGLTQASRLLLSGDNQPFDNRLYLVPLQQAEITLLYIGSDAADDARGLRYYLQHAFPETLRRKVRVMARNAAEPLPAEDLRPARLVVISEALPDRSVAQLKTYMRDGGTALWVLQEAAAGAALAKLMDRPDLQVEEAAAGDEASNDYAMLGEIAFGHPLFATFADPRFNDFTKIHFWRHRRVNVHAEPPLEVLARFDDGAPALFELKHGKGQLLVLTSGWHPDDSQLARSTKFVPLVSGLLERAGGGDFFATQYHIGDVIALPDSTTASGKTIVRKPDRTELRLGNGRRTFTETDQPGVYAVRRDDTSPNDTSLNSGVQYFAVNVAPAESKTDPYDVEELPQRGARLGAERTRAELAEQRRQLRDVELEGMRKLWRWLLVAALAVVVVETWLAGHMSRLTAEPSR